MKPKTDGMLTLYSPLVDWITMTSFHEYFWGYWQSVAARKSDDDREQSRIGYRGVGISTGEGSLFVGQGNQKGRDHYIMQCGGELANGILGHVAKAYTQYTSRVTVLDLQITIPEPDDWQQKDLLAATMEQGKVSGWVESRDREVGPLQTVYIGSWQSDRMIRVYVKSTAENARLLRFEVHYKGLRADAAARSILLRGVTPRQILVAEVQRNGIKNLSPFEKALGKATPHHVRVRQKSSLARTEGWIRKTVIPALNRYANNKAADHSVLSDVRRAIDPPDRLT